MGDGQEGSSEPILEEEEKETKRKSFNKNKGKRSRADGGSSAKDDPSKKDIDGGAEKHKGGSRTDGSKDNIDEGGKGKNSGKRKKSKVDVKGSGSSSGDGTSNRSSSRLEGTEVKDSDKKSSRSRTHEGEAKTSNDEQNLGSPIVRVTPANVLKEPSESTSDKAGSSDAPNAPPSREVDDGIGTVSSPRMDEPESSSALLSTAPGEDGDKNNRRPENISTPAAGESATSKRRASKADGVGANEPTPSVTSSIGLVSAEEMAEEINTLPRQQSNSRVPKSKRSSKDQKSKEKRGTFTAATIVPSSKAAEGDRKRTQEISAEQIIPPPASSTPAIATNATSHHAPIGAGKRASDRVSNGGSRPESANDGTRGEVSDTIMSADVTTPSESTNDTEHVEATPSSHESVAGVSQLEASDFQDMQDEITGLTASPAGGEEGRVDSENPMAIDKRQPPAMRRRSGSADKSVRLKLNEAGGRTATIQGPELGVQVIDEGTTKQLVLTTTIGHRPAEVLNDDAPQEPAIVLVNSPAPRFIYGRRRSSGVIDPDDEIARSIAFRQRFSAVLLGEQDIDSPFTGGGGDGSGGISPEATKSETSCDVSRPKSVGHNELAPVFQEREGHSTSLSPRAVPSLQGEHFAPGDQRPPHPTPLAPRSADGNLSDLLRPSEIMSPSLPECVQEQASFHDALPSGYGQHSPTTVSFTREDCSRIIPTSRTMAVASHESTTRSSSEHKDSLRTMQTGNRGQSYEGQEPRQQGVQICVDFPEGTGDDAKQSALGSRNQGKPGLEKDFAKGESTFGDSEADSEGPLLHFRSDFTRQLVDGNRPAMFFLRSNEGLAVTRVEGSGRLLVTLRVEAGDGVLVDDAIVYDSAADFAHSATLTDHRFPYVEGHRYEFRVVPTQGIALTARRRENIERREGEVHECDNSSQRETVRHGRIEAAHTGLQVSFSIVAAFNANDRLRSADAMRLCAPPIEKGSILSRSDSPALQATKEATSPRPVGSAARFPSPRIQQPSRCDSGKRRRSPPASSSTLASPRRTSPVVAVKTDAYTNTTAHCVSKPTQTLALKASPRAEERRSLGDLDGLMSNAGGTAEGRTPTGSVGPKVNDAGNTGPAPSLISRYEKRTDDGDNFSPVAQPALSARAPVASTCEGQFPPVQRVEGTNRGAMWAGGSDGPPVNRNHKGGQLFSGQPPPFVDSNSPSSLRNNNSNDAHPGRTDLPAGGKEEGWARERQTMQLRWNPAWEGGKVLPSYQVPFAPFTHQPLPLVPRHTDASPRSKCCEQEERQYFPSQHRVCGAHLAYPHWPTTTPVDQRGSDGQHRVDRPAGQGQRQQQYVMPGGVHPPLQYSAAAPHDRGLRRRGIADKIGPPPRGFVAAGGQRRVMDRHTRPWETSSGGNDPLSSRPLGQLGWTNRTNALPTAEGFDPQRARKGEGGNWKIDESMGVGVGFPGDFSAADDERQQRGWEGDENNRNSCHPSSGARYPGHHNVRLDSFGPMAGQVPLASYREAPAPPRPALVDTNEIHRGVTDEHFAPAEHGYRHSGGDNLVVPGDGMGTTRAEEKSPRNLRGGDQLGYNLNTMIELGKKRPPHRARAAARGQPTYARPRRNRQLNGKGMGQISVGNSSGVRQATPPRWLKC